jgi:hypothetical protein
MRRTTLAVILAILSISSSAFAQGTEPPPPPPAEPPLVPPAKPATPPPSERDKEVEARFAADEGRFAADEARIKKLEDKKTNPILDHLKIEGYAQAQFLAQTFNKAASPNLVNGDLPEGIGSNETIAKADGTTTNSTFFRLRRTRLRLKYEPDFMRVFLQFDPAPAGGPSSPTGTIARNVEVAGIARWSKTVKTEIGAGLFQVPFRFELIESSMYRPFIERSWASQNLFPTERDLGVWAKTTALEGDKLIVEAGVVNGQRIGEAHFVELPDLSKRKDLIGRVSYKVGPLNLGAFGYVGRGQRVDAKDLRYKTFDRWGVNLGATFTEKLIPSLGETRGYAELMFGKNMDTGVRYTFGLPAFPTNLADDVIDLHQRGFYIRVEQDFTEKVLAGFRYDMYTIDSAVKNNARDTYTLMAGVRFHKLLRVINEASWIVDNMHAPNVPPPSKHIFQYSLWMQGSFY